ncbi:hypothetical protein NMG60_11016513 [Bertholletia excelsa]
MDQFCSRMMVPIRRIWRAVAKRVRVRKTGKMKLRHEVQTSEYEDIHVLWELLEKNVASSTSTPRTKKRRAGLSHIAHWARRATYLCRNF